MSWFMAAIYDRFMQPMEEAGGAAWRAEILRGLSGTVVELGAGTGANLAHYPAEVERLVLVEPDRHMAARLRNKLAGHPLSGRAEIIEAPLEGLQLQAGSIDAVVATLVLCSVPDPSAALRAIARLLRTGGELRFIEHVASDDPKRLAWQRRLEPLWKRLADNCHLCRRTEAEIEAAGLRIEQIRRESLRKALPIVRGTIRGVARKDD
jgi:ubiquinone/menaquinone biosynthesis C-methylase UbiE